jgi:hypothetical protein
MRFRSAVDRGHGRSGIGGGECEEACGGDAVSEDVEFGDGGYVPGFFDRSTHQHYLLDSEKDLRVCSRGFGQVG